MAGDTDWETIEKTVNGFDVVIEVGHTFCMARVPDLPYLDVMYWKADRYDERRIIGRCIHNYLMAVVRLRRIQEARNEGIEPRIPIKDKKVIEGHKVRIEIEAGWCTAKVSDLAGFTDVFYKLDEREGEDEIIGEAIRKHEKRESAYARIADQRKRSFEEEEEARKRGGGVP